MQRFLLFVCAVVFLLPLEGYAQFDEAGVFVGISHYTGDLTERKVEPLGFHRAGGFYVRKKISPRFGMRYQFFKGRISGDDGRSSTESGLWKRNLSFESDIFEIAALAEYSPFRFGDGLFTTTPYFFGGIAGFYFAPQAEVNGQTYNLNTYRTEGVEYSLYQFAIPFGAGLKLQVNGCGYLGLEVGWRKTFTDYLDDVSGFYPGDLGLLDDGTVSTRAMLSYRAAEINNNSSSLPKADQQRGNPDNNDWYMFFGVTLGMSL